MDEKVIKVVNEARWIDGQNVRRRLDDITHNPMRSQEEFLMRLLRENAKTEYGRKNNFKSIRNMDDFRRYVPLTSYDDYTSYIERLANGERNILTAYLTEHISIWDYFKFHAKMGSTKDRNGRDLIEADNIKKRWQEYTENCTKEIFMTKMIMMV